MNQLDTQKTTAKNKNAYFYVIILYLLFLSDFVCRVGINAILPVIKEDLALTNTEVGMLSSAVLLSMSIFVLPISYLADKFSKKKLIVLMSGIWSIGTLLFGVAKSFPLILLSRFGVGIGNSAYASTSTSIVTNLFDKKQWGKVLGLYNTAMPFGLAFGSMLCGIMAERWGWRVTVLTIGAISMVICLLSLTIPETAGERQDAPQKAMQQKKKINLKTAISVILKNKSLLLVCTAMGITSLAGNIQGTFTTLFYVQDMQMSVTTAATLLGSTGLFAIVTYPLGGYLMDKWYQKDLRSRAWYPSVVCLVKAIVCAAGFYFRSVPLILFSALIGQLAVSSGQVVNQELVPAEYKSFSYGFYVIFIQLLGAIGPTIGGIMGDKMGMQTILVGVQFIILISVVLFALAGFSYHKDFERARAMENNIVEQ